jgi:large subunit ribosomal protein L25
MEKIVLKATRRTITGKKVGALRREGKLPGVLYGRHIQPIPVTLDLRDASRILAVVSSSRILTVDVDGEEFPTLVREKQRDTIKSKFTHIDFQAVSLTEKINAMVAINIIGVSPAVKLYNGMVEVEKNEIEVECLPQYLPEKIDIDISNLNKIGDNIHVKDLKLADEIKILEDFDQIIVAITSMGGEEEAEVTPVEEGVSGEPEVIERGKKEEEEE